MNAPIQSSDFIGELCVALRHRWKPNELFVIFTGYFDESDTHGSAPNVTIGAFLGHALQWRRFEKRLLKLQRKYGFRVFHSKKFKARRGEFEGWPENKCISLISDLTDLVEHKLTMGLTLSLDHGRFMSEYRSAPIPKKMSLDSQYGACFRGCLAHLLNFLEARGNQDRLNIVFEGGHPNVGDCARIFYDLKKRWARAGADVLGSFAIDDKDSCPPLMVADMLAHTKAMVNAHADAGTLPLGALQPFTETTGGLHFLELAPNALADLKAGFERLRQLEVETWRAERDARRASLAGAQKPLS